MQTRQLTYIINRAFWPRRHRKAQMYQRINTKWRNRYANANASNRCALACNCYAVAAIYYQDLDAAGARLKGSQPLHGDLRPDGSLTIYVQADAPPEAQRVNWLPAPKGGDFSFFVRAYWPRAPILDGSWTMPAVEKAGSL